jgi:hypothetical protein
MCNIEGLRAALPNLEASDAKFATDLIRGFEKYGSLTDRQAPWVDRLIDRAKLATEPQKPREQIGDLSKLLALFDRAAKHLKSPAVVILLEQIGEVRISVAGARAKIPGSINVATNGRYGESTWFGRIRRDGTFDPSSRVTTPDTLIDQLQDFASRPAEMAAEHGRLTGRCCFCNTSLENEKSTAVGYGPVCAKKWGLSWGARAAAAAPSLFCDEAAMQKLEVAGDR